MHNLKGNAFNFSINIFAIGFWLIIFTGGKIDQIVYAIIESNSVEINMLFFFGLLIFLGGIIDILTLSLHCIPRCFVWSQPSHGDAIS